GQSRIGSPVISHPRALSERCLVGGHLVPADQAGDAQRKAGGEDDRHLGADAGKGARGGLGARFAQAHADVAAADSDLSHQRTSRSAHSVEYFTSAPNVLLSITQRRYEGSTRALSLNDLPRCLLPP